MSSPNTSLLTTALFMLNASLSYQCENPSQQMMVGQKAWYIRVRVLPGPHFQFTLMYLVPSVKRSFINDSYSDKTDIHFVLLFVEYFLATFTISFLVNQYLTRNSS